MHLIPMPKAIENKEGYYKINYKTEIIAKANHELLRFASELKSHIQQELGFELPVKSFGDCDNIEFVLEATEDLYEVRITTTGVKIVSKELKGLFYGMQTLKQLIVEYKRQLPCMIIKDTPLFENRGYYHDVTRGKVPTLEQLKTLVDIMASFKLDQLQLYVEHTYLYKGQSEVWSVTDPLTAEEIMLLDQYCADKYIELVPSISTFGHLYELLQSKTYCHLSEIDKLEGFSFVDRMNHHTLDVSNEASFQVVKGMIDDFLPLVRSDKFNICADETFDLGEGKNKALAESLGKSKLYVDFLKKIIDYVKGRDKEVMFWGDIIIKHPEHIDDLPKDLICLNWWYWLNYPEEKVKIISDHGFRQYMCPGVNGWNTLMNHHRMAYDNNQLMTAYGEKYQVLGILNTDWGDYGHWNALSNSIPGLIYGAAFSWGEARSYEQLNQSIDTIFFKCKEVMPVLDEISQLHYFTLLPWVQWMEGKSLEWFDRIKVDDHTVLKSITRLEDLVDKLQDIMVNIPTANKHHIMQYIISAEAVKLMNKLYLKARVRLFNASNIVDFSDESLAVEWEHWLLDFKQLWYKENKPSELYRIVAFIQKTNGWLRD